MAFAKQGQMTKEVVCSRVFHTVDPMEDLGSWFVLRSIRKNCKEIASLSYWFTFWFLFSLNFQQFCWHTWLQVVYQSRSSCGLCQPTKGRYMAGIARINHFSCFSELCFMMLYNVPRCSNDVLFATGLIGREQRKMRIPVGFFLEGLRQKRDSDMFDECGAGSPNSDERIVTQKRS